MNGGSCRTETTDDGDGMCAVNVVGGACSLSEKAILRGIGDVFMLPSAAFLCDEPQFLTCRILRDVRLHARLQKSNRTRTNVTFH